MTSDTIHIPVFQVQASQNQTVKVELLKINGVGVQSLPSTITIKKDVATGDEAMQFILTTDRYASEVTFKILNPDGTILLQGGPWPDLSSSGTTVRTFDFIPIMDGCHRVIVDDSYGDGINSGAGAGNIKILNSAGTQIYYNDGRFGSQANAMIDVKLVSIKDVNEVAISIAPNPVNDRLYVTGMYDKLEVISISGQVLTTVYNQPSVDVSRLAKGIYFVKIQSNGQTTTFKVVK